MNIDVEPGRKPKLLGLNSSTEMTQMPNKSKVGLSLNRPFPIGGPRPEPRVYSAPPSTQNCFKLAMAHRMSLSLYRFNVA